MYHGYCIRAAADAPPAADLVGIDGAPVELVGDGVLSVWVSPIDPLGPTPERLRAHDHVVRRALRTATPLPLRYGTVFRDRPMALEALGERREEFLGSLARFAGRLEMGLRIRHAAGAPAPVIQSAAREAEAGPGRQYLESRRRAFEAERSADQEAHAILDEIEAELGDLGLPSVRVIGPRGVMLGSLAHLLHRSEVLRYRERAAALQGARPDLRIDVTGPWAPYSFA